MRNNMEFIHDRKSNILFSLYGSKVNRIKIHNKTLTLTVQDAVKIINSNLNVNNKIGTYFSYPIGSWM